LFIDKITSLLGFAVKSGKIVLGYDRIIEGKAKKFLIICANEINVTAQKRLFSYSKNNDVPLLKTSLDLAKITGYNKCKAIALTDKQMSQAMLNNINDNYQLIVLEEI